MQTSFSLFRRAKNKAFRNFLLSKKLAKKLGKFSLSLALATGVVLGGAALAVDINSASQEALEGVKGIGATRAKLIVEERNKNGAYKSPEDLTSRVKGVGDKTIAKLKEQGLTFESNGSSGGSKNSRSRTGAKSTQSNQSQEVASQQRQRAKVQ